MDRDQAKVTLTKKLSDCNDSEARSILYDRCIRLMIENSNLKSKNTKKLAMICGTCGSSNVRTWCPYTD